MPQVFAEKWGGNVDSTEGEGTEYFWPRVPCFIRKRVEKVKQDVKLPARVGKYCNATNKKNGCPKRAIVSGTDWRQLGST